MRRIFADTILTLAKKDRKIIFLTGDLGFGFFEKLQTTLTDRFVNAGVAEANMATVAAGLAYTGFKPWIFSIAPFVTVKILEQIRNDICLHNTNVKIVGQGGGYDYELAGPTHHALEDIGALMTLPHIQIYIPAAVSDVPEIVKAAYQQNGPSYIRLTRQRPLPLSLSPYHPIRLVLTGNKITMLVLGSLIDKAGLATLQFGKKIDTWLIGQLPFKLTAPIIKSIDATRSVVVVEENSASGGLGQQVATQILALGIKLNQFVHLYAKGYPTKKTGSRDFYLKQTGLDEESITKVLKTL